MGQDFFFSKSTGLYVSRKPLELSSRTKMAADSVGTKLDWDDEGRLMRVDYDGFRRLLDSMGSRMMTPAEYWRILEDAKAEGDVGMVAELTSDEYVELLDRVYPTDTTFIDNPILLGNHSYQGTVQDSRAPVGRPGWFSPEGNIDPETGEPVRIESRHGVDSNTWKYWSPNTASTESATVPIRGYVTSVGMPSFDMGIPVYSRQPKLMVRECRTDLPDPILPAEVLEEAAQAMGDYSRLAAFLEKHGEAFRNPKDSLLIKMRERFFDTIGAAALETDVSETVALLYASDKKEVTLGDVGEFVGSSRTRLEEAISSGKDIVFVMGHKNPDTDTAVSSVFEAYRNHLLNGKDTCYVPVIQAKRLPDEIDHLLGEAGTGIMFTNDSLYSKARETGLARWISVDQNREPEVQKYFISMIDHHVASPSARKRDIPKTLEMAGSCASLVERKLLGMGCALTPDAARVLYAATLMDTENRAPHKMTEHDEAVMARLQVASGVTDDSALYQELMSKLLSTDDAEELFRRDYKEDWGFGFAVEKTKGVFGKDGEAEKPEILARLVSLAEENNRARNLPLTLVKLTDYEEDNERVRKERVYSIFGDRAGPDFRKAVESAVEGIIRFQFPDDSVETGQSYVEFHGTGMQLSRKQTAPVIQPIVAAFDRFFYSPSIGKWVARDFLRDSPAVRAAMEGVSVDKEGRVSRITYEDAKELCEGLGYGMLSLNEFWKALSDAKGISDSQMVSSMRGADFVEFMDSAIIDSRYLVDHPAVYGGKIEGVAREVVVPAGSPGLISPDEIDMDTGIPKIVRSPNQYDDPTLWRYWAPDAPLVVPCRSSIFLMGSPCWDGKFHLGEGFPKLGIRPVTDKPESPELKLGWDADRLRIIIGYDGGTREYAWPRKIADYAE